MADYTQPEFIDKRVRYFNGQLLHEQDFIDEQRYHLDRQQRQARLFLSSGVAQGMGVKKGAEAGTLVVEPGTALDPQGRLIVLKEQAVVPVTLRNASRATLYVYWREQESDEAKGGGSSGNTRWHELPGFEVVKPGETPKNQPAIPLAELEIDNVGNISLNDNRRALAGVSSPNHVGWAGASSLSTDQGGSIVLGNSLQAGATPYIDFHYGIGVAQDYNVRIQNTADRMLAILGGKLGIGTASPRTPLHVKGNDAVLALEGSDHAYIEYYPDGVNGGRKAWLGFGSANDNNLSIRTDHPNGHILLLSTGGNVSVGTYEPLARLSVVANGADQIIGLAHSETFRTSAGKLGEAAGAELKLASIGFHSANHTSLGFRAQRVQSGKDWTTTAIGMGIDVDSTPWANDTSLWLHSGGKVGVGTASPRTPMHVKGNGALLTLEGSDHASIQYYPHGADGGRKAWMGFGNPNDGNLSIRNEHPRGNLLLSSNGGNVTVFGARLRVSESDGQQGNAVLELTNGPKTNYIFTEKQSGHLHLRTDSAAHHVLLQTGGTQGRVGIGTAEPWAPLHVRGNESVLALEGTDRAYISFFPGGTGAGQKAWLGFSELNTSSITIANQSQEGDIWLLTTGGKVGVRTREPKAWLHVRGNAAVLGLEGSDHAYIAYYPEGYGSGRKAWMGFGGVDDNNLTIANEHKDAHILLTPNGGNVGVGTWTPQARLHVEGGGAIINGFVGIKELEPDHTLVVGPRNGGRHLVINDIRTARWGFTTGAFALRIQNDGDNGNWATRMVITREGKIGIGTGDVHPTSMLQLNVPHAQPVNGLAINALTFGDGANARASYYLRAGDLGNGSTAFIIRGDASVGIGTASPGHALDVVGVVRAHSFIPPSDARLKTEVRQLEGMLARLSAIRGVSFLWKNSTGRTRHGREIGVIAQEIEEIFPELVVEGSDGVKGVDYDKITAILIEAVKELEGRNSELHQRLDRLEQQSLNAS